MVVGQNTIVDVGYLGWVEELAYQTYSPAGLMPRDPYNWFPSEPRQQDIG